MFIAFSNGENNQFPDFRGKHTFDSIHKQKVILYLRTVSLPERLYTVQRFLLTIRRIFSYFSVYEQIY